MVEDVVTELESLGVNIDTLHSEIEGARGSAAHAQGYSMVMGLQQRRHAYMNKLGVLGTGIGLVVNRKGGNR